MRNAAGISANPGYEKETDVHYWVTDGQGIFNHRMIWLGVGLGLGLGSGLG